MFVKVVLGVERGYDAAIDRNRLAMVDVLQVEIDLLDILVDMIQLLFRFQAGLLRIQLVNFLLNQILSHFDLVPVLKQLALLLFSLLESFLVAVNLAFFNSVIYFIELGCDVCLFLLDFNQHRLNQIIEFFDDFVLGCVLGLEGRDLLELEPVQSEANLVSLLVGKCNQVVQVLSSLLDRFTNDSHGLKQLEVRTSSLCFGCLLFVFVLLIVGVELVDLPVEA